jgi:hypothetical protein
MTTPAPTLDDRIEQALETAGANDYGLRSAPLLVLLLQLARMRFPLRSAKLASRSAVRDGAAVLPIRTA